MMTNTHSIGGTANIRAIDAINFSVAMTGVFSGGVYAKTTGTTESADGKKHYELRHYFVTDDGIYLYTQDKSVHTPVDGTMHFAQTEYSVVEAGGSLKACQVPSKAGVQLTTVKALAFLDLRGSSAANKKMASKLRID